MSSHHRVDFYNKISCGDLSFFPNIKGNQEGLAFSQICKASVLKKVNPTIHLEESVPFYYAIFKDKHDRIISPPRVY